MTQSRITSANDIYDVLSNDTEFMSYVGQYKFSNGATSSSLSIVTPGRGLTDLYDCNGLEVIIHDASSRVTRMDFLTDESISMMTYQVFLLLWEPALGDVMNNASNRIIKCFSNTNVLRTVPMTDNKNILVQSIAEISSNAVVLI